MKRLVLSVCLIVLVACSTASPPTPTTAPATATATPGATATTSAARATSTPATLGTARVAGTTSAEAQTRGRVGTPGTVARAPVSPTRRTTPATPRPNTTPAAGAALIVQVMSQLLDQYVDPLNSAELYGTAYDSAVKTLQASGKAPQVQRPAFTGDPRRDAAIFTAAYLALAGPAGPDTNQTDLSYTAIRAVVEQIRECHTYFLDPDQHKRTADARAGAETYTGIGVTVRTQIPVVVGRVFPGTPAERSGLRSGDAILAVDGIDVSTLTFEEVGPLVRGPEGTQVTLTIRRPGEGTSRRITITRARITIPAFEAEVRAGPNGTKVGYMQLYSFSAPLTPRGELGEGVEREVQQALEDFQRQGVTSWVLDLRENGGGYVTVLARVASRFIQDGQPVAYTISTDGGEEPVDTDPRLYFQPQRPFAVLINGGSASASDALAAAAQDYGFARVFGQTSAGCLGAGQLFPLSDGSAMNITVEKVVSAKRREINRVGVQPDETVAPDPTGNSDPVLDAAIRWLATQR